MTLLLESIKTLEKSPFLMKLILFPTIYMMDSEETKLIKSFV